MARKTKTPDVPAFDLSALTTNVETAVELPSRAQTAPRDKRFENNPFVDILRASYQEGMNGGKAGRQVTVAGYHVKDTSAAIRDAADKLADESIGARVVYKWNDTVTAKVTDVPTDDTTVTILFEGQTRKRYLTFKEKQEARALGFVDGNRVKSTEYREWVDAGRPMEDDVNAEDNEPQDY